MGLLSVLAADVPARDAGAEPASGDGGRAREFVPPVPSPPRCTPTGRVTFRLAAAESDGGDRWRGRSGRRGQCQKDAAGVWSVTLGPLDPDMYHYTFVVNGVRTIDPAPFASVAAGAVSSTTYSRFVIRGETPAIDELLPLPHGVVRQHFYRSKSLDVVRRVVVYTPPDYDSSTKRTYPVLYLLHGARNGETFWTDFALVNLVVDNLIASGAAKPLVIVMPNGNTPGRPPRAPRAASRTGSDRRRHPLGRIGVPREGWRPAPSDCRLLPGRPASVAPSALTHLGRFSHLATFSAALADTQPSATFATLPAQTTTVNGKLPFIWIGCGTEDGLFPANEQASASLRERGITHTFHKTSGGHSWKLSAPLPPRTPPEVVCGALSARPRKPDYRSGIVRR